MPESPNIVLICADQMRWDCLSIAGHPAVETPRLDYMASRGVRFTNAHTAVPSCIAARAALFTGLSQRSHRRVGYEDGVVWDYPHTLAGEFTKAGYHTIAIGKMHVFPQRNMLGFKEVILHDGELLSYGPGRQSDYEDWLRRTAGEDCGMLDHGLPANSWISRPWHLAEYQHPTYWVASRGVEFIRKRNPAQPFFMFMSFVPPHPPLIPPQCYFDQYLREDLPVPPVGSWVSKIPLDPQQGRWEPNSLCAMLDPRAQHRAQAGYYGLITQIDHQIGRFLEHLREHRLLDNTIFMFVSDHGEMMGDHHFFRKAWPYAGSVRVPLIVQMPPRFGIKPGTPDELVELRDIMPTLLDAAGLPVPSALEGRSMMPIIRGQKGLLHPHLHGEHSWWNSPISNHYITDGRFKYIWFSRTGVEQLFDTENDLYEQHDLVDLPEQAANVKRLRQILINELTGREEGYTDGGQLIVGRNTRGTLSLKPRQEDIP